MVALLTDRLRSAEGQVKERAVAWCTEALNQSKDPK